jgi:hypothetical protein
VLKLNRFQRLVAIGILAVAAGALGIYLYLNRGPSNAAELAAYLPDKDGTLVYVDVAALRKSGLLTLLAGSKAAEESEYKEFVQQTGFDYKHDLDALAATFRGGQVFFAVRGQFDWAKFHAYAEKHGGSCKGSYCAVEGSTPQRRISFYPLRSNLLAMAISSDDMAAYQVTRNASKPNLYTPAGPIWMVAPAAVLKESDSLPPGIRSFGLALQNADRAVFSAGQEAGRVQLTLEVTSPNVEAASALLVQLENTTNMLRKLLAREHKQPNAADLSGILSSGSFRRDDRKVLGTWPLPQEFLESITGGSH